MVCLYSTIVHVGTNRVCWRTVSQIQLPDQECTDRNAVKSCSLFSVFYKVRVALKWSQLSPSVCLPLISYLRVFIKFCTLGAATNLSSKRQFSCQPLTVSHDLHTDLKRFSTNVNHIPSITVAQDGTTARSARSSLVQRRLAH